MIEWRDKASLISDYFSLFVENSCDRFIANIERIDSLELYSIENSYW